MINLDAASLLDILPPNLRTDTQVAAAAIAIDGELQAITAAIRQLTYFDRLDSLTSEEADELAWQWHVDFYDPTLPLEQRRELVKKSYAWHRRKGTPAAVEELIETIFGSGEVQEWFQYGGQPGYFKVVTSDPDANTTRAQEFLAAINSVKNERSWLEAIEITTEGTMNLRFGFALHYGDHITMKQVV
jgi:phage tail P2-like protein